MSKEHLRPQYGMVITNDGTKLQGSKEEADYEPSPMMALLAGHAMQLMKQKMQEDEAAGSEKKPCTKKTHEEGSSVACASAVTAKPQSEARKKKGRSGKSSNK